MIERVRALLVTPSNELLTIRRDRPGIPTYWVLPGGHLEPEDVDLESGLHREVYEELGGKAEIVSLVAILDGQDDRQYRQHRGEVAGLRRQYLGSPQWKDIGSHHLPVRRRSLAGNGFGGPSTWDAQATHRHGMSTRRNEDHG